MSMSISLLITGITSLIILIGVVSYILFNLQPVASQLVATQLGATQLGATQLGATQLAATQPVATQPAATQPAAIQFDTYDSFKTYINNEVLAKYDKNAAIVVDKYIEKKKSNTIDVNIKALIAAANLLTLIGQNSVANAAVTNARIVVLDASSAVHKSFTKYLNIGTDATNAAAVAHNAARIAKSEYTVSQQNLDNEAVVKKNTANDVLTARKTTVVYYTSTQSFDFGGKIADKNIFVDDDLFSYYNIQFNADPDVKKTVFAALENYNAALTAYNTASKIVTDLRDTIANYKTAYTVAQNKADAYDATANAAYASYASAYASYASASAAADAAYASTSAAAYFAANAAYAAANAAYAAAAYAYYAALSTSAAAPDAATAAVKATSEATREKINNIWISDKNLKKCFIYAAGIIYLRIGDLLKDDTAVFKKSLATTPPTTTPPTTTPPMTTPPMTMP